MKIFNWNYKLSTKKNLNGWDVGADRSGGLIKVAWGDGLTGYSDLFPWPEFGDPSYELLIEDLTKDLASVSSQNQIFSSKNPLIKRAMERALVDAKARRSKVSLFEGLLIPESHGLLAPSASLDDLVLLRERGFQIFKLKMTGNPILDLPQVHQFLSALRESESLRLDFNGLVGMEDFFSILKAIQDHSENWTQIDLIEDPWFEEGEPTKDFTLPKKLWKKFASDFFTHPSWENKVIKSARAYGDEVFRGPGRRIITHSMDHPVGQAFSLFEAASYEAERGAEEIHGVARCDLYKSTNFDWVWQGFGSKPEPPPGFGIGFDEILCSLDWKPLQG